MPIEHLYLFNFKSYAEREFYFEPTGINCIVGVNGVGKSNLLDAIHVLCLTKSGFGYSDSDLVRHGQEGFAIKGLINRQKIICSYSPKGKKLMLGDYTLPRLADYIGQNPCVLITPADQALVEEGSEVRRRFFDMAISQRDAAYLNSLTRYNSLLRRRNALLKQYQETSRLDHDLLDSYTLPLAQENENITQKRQTFIADFLPIFQLRHKRIATHSAETHIIYQADITQQAAWVMQQATAADLKAGRTTRGCHRDEYRFILASQEIKRFGSQGQIKTFVLALKLALYEIYPNALLLLDDIFDKLDEHRIAALLGFLAEQQTAQFFLTDARAERSQTLLLRAGLTANFINLS